MNRLFLQYHCIMGMSILGICRGSEITDIVVSDMVNAAVEKRAAGR